MSDKLTQTLLECGYQPTKKKPKNKNDIFDSVYEHCHEKVELIGKILNCATAELVEGIFTFPIRKDTNDIELSIIRSSNSLSITLKNIKGYNFGLELDDSYLFTNNFPNFEKQEIQKAFNNHDCDLSNNIDINIEGRDHHVHDKDNFKYYVIRPCEGGYDVYKENFFVPVYDFKSGMYRWSISTDKLIQYGGSFQLYLLWEQKEITLFPDNYVPDQYPERICASEGIKEPKRHYFYVHYMPQLAPLFMLIVRDYVSWVCAYLEDDKNIELEVNGEPSRFKDISISEEREVHECFLKASAELLGLKIKENSKLFFKRIPGEMPYLVKPDKEAVIKEFKIAIQNQNASMNVMPFQYSEKPYCDQKSCSIVNVLKDIANLNYDYFGHNFPKKKPDEINKQLSLLYYLSHHWEFCTPDYIKCYLAHISWLPSFFRDPNSKICRG